MKRKLHLIVILCLIPYFLSAAGSQETQKSITIEDSTGNVIVLDKIPQRITFVGKASNIVADTLYMFPEAHSRIVGVGNTNQRNGDFIEILDKNYSDKIYLEHSVGPEQIAVTRPDLVILKNFHKGSLGASVAKLGVPVLYLDLESPESYESDIKILGQIFNNPGRAEELIQYYKDQLQFVLNRTDKITNKPDVLFIYHSSSDGISAFNIPPKNWIQTRMVEIAGGNPVWVDANPGNGWSKINLEQIAAWNPEQIYVVAYKEDIGKVLESINNSTQWQEFAAFKNGKIKAFPVDFYSWDQPDSRWIIGLKWLAKQVHPELFTDLDIEVMTRSFYRDLYELSDDEFNKEIKTRLGW
ncbi:MAG: ABC transporter substrate-binding protein [Spirochaetaceae bacterium]|nr:ABC transporter substrate-binding protein [Spirochaetaceae bacterium]